MKILYTEERDGFTQENTEGNRYTRGKTVGRINHVYTENQHTPNINRRFKKYQLTNNKLNKNKSFLSSS